MLRETAPNLKCMCLRGMTRVYERHSAAIGAFEDTDYIVFLLSQAQHAEVCLALPSSPRPHTPGLTSFCPPQVRDRLLLLLLALSTHPLNCEKLINPDCLELLVDLLTTAHTTDPELRATASLASGGSSLLLLTNAPPGFSVPGGGAEGRQEVAENLNPKESLKVRALVCRESREPFDAPRRPLCLRRSGTTAPSRRTSPPGRRRRRGPTRSRTCSGWAR